MRSCFTGAVLFLVGCGASPSGPPAIDVETDAPTPACVVATGELEAGRARERAACVAWIARICSDCGRRWPECVEFDPTTPAGRARAEATCASDACETRSLDEVLESAALLECRVAAPAFEGRSCDIDDRACTGL